MDRAIGFKAMRAAEKGRYRARQRRAYARSLGGVALNKTLKFGGGAQRYSSMVLHGVWRLAPLAPLRLTACIEVGA
jgi:hypothetical protein